LIDNQLFGARALSEHYFFKSDASPAS